MQGKGRRRLVKEMHNLLKKNVSAHTTTAPEVPTCPLCRRDGHDAMSLIDMLMSPYSSDMFSVLCSLETRPRYSNLFHSSIQF